MARRRKGRNISGWIVIDKPPGLTSARVVGRVRQLYQAAKAGHAGTLDPLATGVLPIALGEATKTVPYVTDDRKSYRFTLRWGAATSTDDLEGDVIAESDRRPDRAAIEAALPAFTGCIAQVPPRYSAVKVEGRRAYDRARAQESFELRSRLVEIDTLSLIDQPGADEATFEVICGKGTYMRSLARDLGEALDTRAHITALRRLAVGPFTADHAISLDYLESLGHSPAAFEQLRPIETALDDIPALALSEIEANRLRCGQTVSFMARIHRQRIENLNGGDIVFVTAGGRPVAMARYEAGEIFPVRVLNL
jgi:tRNA pseudouridine55 synthase